jgi:NadR type nicotinamide-nucleotide adenylyltransferase
MEEKSRYEMTRRIVIIGPESTGKSTLCEQLAAHYHTFWTPEYAREYLLKNGTDYSYNDLLTIAKKQIELEEQTASKVIANLFFIDTDMYVMKVWCEFVYGKCHQWILDRIAERRYDLYLLCNTDLAWVKDELREYPDLESRSKLFHIYKDNMINQHVPWKTISGNDLQRLDSAIAEVNRLLKE